MIAAGDVVSCLVEKPAAGGRMIARVDGLVVLVAGAIPGEQVTASIERVGKGVAYAQVVSIEQPSPDRRPSAGDPLCGGCLYSYIDYSRQLTLKAAVIADAFARIAKLALPSDVVVAASPEDGYRMRARLHLREGRVGFFREGTHDLCDPRQTRQLLPATCDTLARMAEAMGDAGPSAVREIEITENVDATDRVVQFDGPVDAASADRLAAVEGVTGVVFGRDVRGSAFVSDRIAGVQLRRHVGSFFQGNRFLLADLVAAVVGHVPEGIDLVDLYAGTGLFSIAAAVSRSARVTAVEGDPFGAADLAANAKSAAAFVRPHHQSVETFLDKPRTAGCVIVDPPRTGMSRQALDGLVRMSAPRIVYVSCDVATLARDARKLSDQGYTISSVEAFDLFPNTPHVEVVGVFEK